MNAPTDTKYGAPYTRNLLIGSLMDMLDLVFTFLPPFVHRVIVAKTRYVFVKVLLDAALSSSPSDSPERVGILPSLNGILSLSQSLQCFDFSESRIGNKS